MAMLQDTHDRIAPFLARRDYGFRWRGKDISRLEGLSDAVFGFAITLLVVSLEAPKTFADLERMMHGIVSFGACFALLLLIWHSQYVFFRRYALDDGITFVLNAMLLFVVAFYVYPMKFLASVFVNGITGYREVDAAGIPIVAMQYSDWRSLMLIYSVGFVGIYLVFALLYLHAHRLRDRLELNVLERFETRAALQEHGVMIGIGSVALILAAADMPRIAGGAYILIGPLRTILGIGHGRHRKRLVSETPESVLAAPLAS